LSGRYLGIFVGVNDCHREREIADLRFAEADAEELFSLLTDPVIGMFRAEDATLLTGTDATTSAVKSALRRAAFDAQAADVLLFFFAGHGILTAWNQRNEPYLGTSDIDLARLESDPDAGIRMSFLRRDVFELSPARSLLVLDCCHAGAYISDGRGGHAGNARTLSQAFDEFYHQYQPRNHSALLSCPENEVARERGSLGHGVFTYHLLQGLRKDAAGANGEVTLEELASYVAGLDHDPPPGRFIQGWGRTIVLTRPNRRRPRAPESTAADPGLTGSSIRAFEAPLDRSISSLRRILHRLFSPAGFPTPRSSGQTIQLIKQAIEADAIAIVELSADQSSTLNATEPFQPDELSEAYAELVE